MVWVGVVMILDKIILRDKVLSDVLHCFVPAKTYLYVFLVAVRFSRVLKQVYMPFFAVVRFLHLLKHMSAFVVI
jgi:hypothetical protein